MIYDWVHAWCENAYVLRLRCATSSLHFSAQVDMYRGVLLGDRELERQVIAISGLFTIVFIRANDAPERVQSSLNVISAVDRFYIGVAVTSKFILDKKVVSTISGISCVYKNY